MVASLAPRIPAVRSTRKMTGEDSLRSLWASPAMTSLRFIRDLERACLYLGQYLGNSQALFVELFKNPPRLRESEVWIEARHASTSPVNLLG